MRINSRAAAVLAAAALGSVACPAPTPVVVAPPPAPAHPDEAPPAASPPRRNEYAEPDPAKSADELAAEGVAIGARGELMDALLWFDAALAKDPRHLKARYNQAVTFANLGRIAEAEASFQAFLEVRPTDVAARYELARIQAQQSRGAAALDSLELAVRDGLADPAALKAGGFGAIEHELRYLALQAVVAQRAAAAGRPVPDDEFAREGSRSNYGGLTVPGLKLPGVRNAGECKRQPDGTMQCTADLPPKP